MSEKVIYYDVCPECDSSQVVINESDNGGDLLTFWCRVCGAEWDDYIEDIRKDYQ